MKKIISILLLTIPVLANAGHRVVVTPFGGEGTDYFLTKSSFDMPFNSRAANSGLWVYHQPDPVLLPGDTLMINAKTVRDLKSFGFDGTFSSPIVIYPFFALGTPDTCTLRITGEFFLWGDHWKISGRPNGVVGDAVPGLINNNRIIIGNPDPSIASLPTYDQTSGIEAFAHSGHLEVDCVTFDRLAYGIKWKTDQPQDADICGPDTTLQFPHNRMVGLNVHSCLFRNIHEDVIYAGNTDPLGLRLLTQFGVSGISGKIPAAIDSVDIHHCRFEGAGRTVNQFARCETFGAFHGNYIRNAGLVRRQDQGCGVIIGGMSNNIWVYDNIIKCTFLYGIEQLGAGGRGHINGNTIDSAGIVDASGWLWSQFVDMDSLKAAERRTDYNVIGNRFLVNTNVGGIYNIIAFTDSTYPHTTMSTEIKDNLCGLNTRFDGFSISFPDNFKGHLEDWQSDNNICSNFKFNGTPVTIYRGSFNPGTGSEPWPRYSAACYQNTTKPRKKGKTVYKQL